MFKIEAIMVIMFAFSSVIGTTLAPAQETHATLSGTVVDESNNSIEGANVELTLQECYCKDCKEEEKCNCCPEQIHGATDINGRFRLLTFSGTYSLKISLIGYTEFTTQIIIDSDEESNLKIILKNE